jgi:hypothetical protein
MLVSQDAGNVYFVVVAMLATKLVTTEHDGEKLLRHGHNDGD